MTETITQDFSAAHELDAHYAEQRAQVLRLEANAHTARIAEAAAVLHNERIRRTGIATLMGGAGVGLALLGASFLIAPKEHIVTVPGPERVVTVPGPERVVPGPERVVTKEVLGPERIVTKEVPGPERIVKVPEYVTPKEKDFTERPEYKSAKLKGHLVADADGLIRFDTGEVFKPLITNPATGLLEQDNGAMYDTAPYLGDLAYCNAVPGSDPKTNNGWQQYNCMVIHKDVVIDLNTTRKQKNAKADPCPRTSENGLPILVCGAVNMVNIDVEVGAGYPVKAMVDTGCAYPMSVPEILARVLLKKGLATFAGTTKTVLANGEMKEGVEVIMINQVTVDGRNLQDVEAVVSPSTTAPILLGLGALNRLGPYKIEEGKLVFIGGQPT